MNPSEHTRGHRLTFGALLLGSEAGVLAKVDPALGSGERQLSAPGSPPIRSATPQQDSDLTPKLSRNAVINVSHKLGSEGACAPPSEADCRNERTATLPHPASHGETREASEAGLGVNPAAPLLLASVSAVRLRAISASARSEPVGSTREHKGATRGEIAQSTSDGATALAERQPRSTPTGLIATGRIR
jgi:hypothetical protein